MYHINEFLFLISEIKELFRIFDTNNDRSISLHELGKAMRYLGMSPTQQQISEAMRTLDKNGNILYIYQS